LLKAGLSRAANPGIKILYFLLSVPPYAQVYDKLHSLAVPASILEIPFLKKDQAPKDG
jgi:hypothetical protein